MTGPIVVAQANNSQGPGGAAPRLVAVNKPQGQQAITIHLDGSVKLDLSAIANEKITLVHLGDRLIILFDNNATVTIEPFYGDNGQPLPDVTVELGPGRDISGADFAGLFPVSTDPAVLPASGGLGSVSSGAYFTGFSIDALAGAGPGLGPLGPSEFGRPDFLQSQVVARGGIGESLTGAGIGAATDEGGLITDSIGTTGNDRGFAFSVTGAPGSLAALVDFGTGGPNAIPFQFAPTASAWLAGLGLSSHGSPIDSATVAGQTLTGLAHDGHAVFTLTLNSDSSWKFTLLAPLDQPQGADEQTVTIDLSGLVQAVDSAGLTLTLVDDFKIGVVDDMPVAALGVTVSGTVATAGLITETPPVFLAESFGGADIGPQGSAGSAQTGGPAGQLETLVHFGADGENPAPFSFVSNAIDVLTGFNLVAAGELVNFATVTTTASGTTLTAFTEGSSAGIEAFTLTLGNDGSWAFTMLAPLSHQTIDLSGLVQATDFDGSITGLAANALTVRVTGDVPTLIPGAEDISGTANEGGLVGVADGGSDPFGTGNEPALPSQTGGPTFDPNPPFEISGSLNSLVNFGGDGRNTVPFQFTIGDKAELDLNGTTSGALDLGLKSHGVSIDFATISAASTTGETLTAYAGGSAAGTQVFTLTINGDGSWLFTLLGPIDHSNDAPLTIDL
ncbi:MAG: large repetitive protein, partial [Alphaproteobacteria bacterium]|nr:large repetitive protein [Alphaproteobacteria bacterium]